MSTAAPPAAPPAIASLPIDNKVLEDSGFLPTDLFSAQELSTSAILGNKKQILVQSDNLSPEGSLNFYLSTSNANAYLIPYKTRLLLTVRVVQGAALTPLTIAQKKRCSLVNSFADSIISEAQLSFFHQKNPDLYTNQYVHHSV